MIKDRCKTNDTFKFQDVSAHEVFEEISKLNPSKKTSGSIPVSLSQFTNKELQVVSTCLAKCFNKSLETAIFPAELAWADVMPVHKKDSTTDKSNYRPISLFPSASKVFEKIIFEQLTSFFENKLSKFLCGFRKRYSTQHALMNLIKDWQSALDRSSKVETILMDI